MISFLPSPHREAAMWIKIDTSWHFVAWTDSDYISTHGEMLHRTRCGLLKIRPAFPDFPYSERTCEKCLRLITKDAANNA